MNVLYLTEDLPYPPDSGARSRSYNLIKRAQPAARITLLTAASNAESFAERRAEMLEYCSEVLYTASPDHSRYDRFLDRVIPVDPTLPRKISPLHLQAFGRKVAELCESGAFDLVHCDSVYLAPAIPVNCPIPAVLTEHQIESEIWEQREDAEKLLLKRLYSNRQIKKIEAFEGEMCRKFDLVIAVSDEDRIRLAMKYKIHHVAVVPNGVDTDYFIPVVGDTIPHSLVFVGAMDVSPNDDAIRYFMKSIWPMVKQSCAGAHLWIVGGRPPKEIARMAKNDTGLTVTGRVVDVRDYVGPAAVFVNPHRTGGGSRLKILEALAMEKAVVSSTIGSQGLGLRHSEQILLADTPAEFAARVLELFDRPALRASMGRLGRQVVLDNFDWRIVVQKLVQSWEAAIGSRREKLRAEGKQDKPFPSDTDLSS
jgi:polysaccharide biosynthesis protein PslH